MKFFVQNTGTGLIPLYPSDLDEKKRLKIGKVYCGDFAEWKERNYNFLKKFMALIKIGCENSKNVEMPFDTYRNYATIKAGYAKIHQTPKGTFVEAESISFKNMSEEKFEKVYSDVLDFIIKDTGADKETLENELGSFL